MRLGVHTHVGGNGRTGSSSSMWPAGHSTMHDVRTDTMSRVGHLTMHDMRTDTMDDGRCMVFFKGLCIMHAPAPTTHD